MNATVIHSTQYETLTILTPTSDLVIQSQRETGIYRTQFTHLQRFSDIYLDMSCAPRNTHLSPPVTNKSLNNVL